MERSVPIIPPGAFTLRFLYGVAVAFAVFSVYLYFRSTSGLAPDKAHDQLLGMAAMIGVDFLLVGIIVWAVQRRSLVVGSASLTIKSGFYTRTIPLSSLRVSEGVVASLLEQRELGTRWRTNGIRVPGFRAGWFRLAKGEKAFVLLTDPRTVTYLPTRAGFSLLVSTGELLRTLQSSQPPAVD